MGGVRGGRSPLFGLYGPERNEHKGRGGKRRWKVKEEVLKLQKRKKNRKGCDKTKKGRVLCMQHIGG